jgi:hypothetical protein
LVKLAGVVAAAMVEPRDSEAVKQKKSRPRFFRVTHWAPRTNPSLSKITLTIWVISMAVLEYQKQGTFNMTLF